jgi:hypothetical protein
MASTTFSNHGPHAAGSAKWRSLTVINVHPLSPFPLSAALNRPGHNPIPNNVVALNFSMSRRFMGAESSKGLVPWQQGIQPRLHVHFKNRE